jgi:hypothetical protein
MPTCLERGSCVYLCGGFIRINPQGGGLSHLCPITGQSPAKENPLGSGRVDTIPVRFDNLHCRKTHLHHKQQAFAKNESVVIYSSIGLGRFTGLVAPAILPPPRDGRCFFAFAWIDRATLGDKLLKCYFITSKTYRPACA